jgi:hypothetical protein
VLNYTSALVYEIRNALVLSSFYYLASLLSYCYKLECKAPATAYGGEVDQATTWFYTAPINHYELMTEQDDG